MRALLAAGALALALAFTAVAGLVPTAAFAQAAPAATTVVDLHPIASAATEVVVDVAVGFILVLGAWLSMELKKKWNIDVQKSVSDLEANYRDTLHSAVETWTKSAIAKFGPSLSFDTHSEAAAYVINGVASSAPDAVAALKPSERWIVAKAAGIAGVDVPAGAIQ